MSLDPVRLEQVIEWSGGVVDDLSAAREALAALAGTDLHALTDGQLLDRSSALVALRNRIEAELARTVRRAELAQAPERDGLETMRSWQRGHCHLSNAAASAVVRAGRVMESLPAVAAGFSAGAISAEQVAVIAPVADPARLALAADHGVDLKEIDRTLAGFAAAHPFAELRQVVHRYLSWLDQDGPEPDPTEGRRLAITVHDDGTVSGRFELDAIGGEKWKDHPLPTARTLAAGPWGWPDPRAAAGRRAGAVVRQPTGSRVAAHAAEVPAAGGGHPHRRRPVRQRHRPRCRPDGVRCGPVRRGRPVDGL
jgi:uncharacterized protein DUF222